MTHQNFSQTKTMMYSTASETHATSQLGYADLQSNSYSQEELAMDSAGACKGTAGTFGTLGCATGCAGTLGTAGTYGCGSSTT